MKFSTKEEKKYQKTFLKNGYLIFDIKNKKILDEIKNLTIKLCIKWLKKKKNFFVIKNKKDILDKIHNFIEPKELNEFRLYIYGSINGSKNFQKLYYNLGKEYIDILCGNELVMQKKCNLSIQLPKDDSSLLPLHADVWVGDSEYELVFWLPLVNVYKTKAMYILPPKDNDKYSKNFKKYRSVNDIFNKVKKNIKWLKVDYGQGLLFTQNLMHGNVVNVEKGTRWSFNCRFKSIFSPYRDKELGAFFTPITVRPLTILGMNYKFPNV
jgi:sporadic carbohydrate cluster 2OG-Fe(II) oxygenase